MVRRYDEPIEVRDAAHEDAPASFDGGPGRRPDAFVWRGRLYVVRAILDQWNEHRPWWRDARGGHEVLVGARQRRVWRVEASPGRLGGAGVYDLAATPPDSPAAGGQGHQWQLLRVAD